MTSAKALLKKTRLYAPVRTLWLQLKQPAWWKRRQEQLAFYSRLAPKGVLCFDVGANTGDYTADMLEIGMRVIAVEPQKPCVDQLRSKYGADRRVVLVPAAVGPAEGSITMHTSDATAIGSCSMEWLDAVKASGRFEGHDWTKPIEVPMTTLDKLIAEHGRPEFCKIDVEGFELDVLHGLSTPIAVMSFEFSPETIDRTRDCVEYLSEIGDYRFNYCAHGLFNFGLPERLNSLAFREALRSLPERAMRWGGDVYAWCDSTRARAA
jgi:FkbM family methyltransferase